MRETVALSRKALGDWAPATLVYICDLGELMLELQRPRVAIELFEEEVRILSSGGARSSEVNRFDSDHR